MAGGRSGTTPFTWISINDFWKAPEDESGKPTVLWLEIETAALTSLSVPGGRGGTEAIDGQSVMSSIIH